MGGGKAKLALYGVRDGAFTPMLLEEGEVELGSYGIGGELSDKTSTLLHPLNLLMKGCTTLLLNALGEI